MGIGDGSITHDFKPFIDFLLGSTVSLIIILFTSRLFTVKQNNKNIGQIFLMVCKYILAGIASVILIRTLGIYLVFIYGFVTWVPIYIIVNLLKSNPESYLPTVISDISTIIFSFLFSIIAMLVKRNRICENYSVIGFILGIFLASAVFYFNVLIFLLLVIAIMGALTIARITQSTNFRKADLTNANFTSANLEATDFTGARLTNTDFTRVKF